MCSELKESACKVLNWHYRNCQNPKPKKYILKIEIFFRAEV